MRLGCEVDYYVGLFVFEDLVDSFTVSDISLVEYEIRILHRVFESRHITCICKAIYTYDLIIGMLIKHVINKITADESGTACY